MHTVSCTYKVVVSIYGNYLSTVVTAYSNTCLLKSLYTAATCPQWSTYLHSIWEPPVHSGQHTCTVYGSHLSTVVNIRTCTVYGSHLSTVVNIPAQYMAATCPQWSTYLHSIWQPPVHSGQHTCTVYGSHLSTVVNIPAQYMAATCPQWSTYLHSIWQPPVHSGQHTCTVYGSHLSTVVNIPAQYMAATCPQWSTYLHSIWELAVYRILPNPNDNIQTHNPKAASILGNYPNLRGTGQNQ